MRIVSLLPSSTELICALGFEHNLVARSHECDFPRHIEMLPPVTAPKFDPDGRSYQINERVKAILQESTSVYRIDADLLKQLAPDVIVTQTQCEVCAVSFDEVQRVACDWLGLPAQIIALEPNTLADVYGDVERLGAALGVPQRAAALIGEMQTRIGQISARTAGLPRRRVAALEWLDPLMAAGNWMPELFDQVAAENLFVGAGQHSPWITWEQLSDADPDLIVILPCGYDIERTQRELSALVQHPAWSTLRAVQQQQVYVTDGNQYFNRPGPRLVESVEILAEILHPTLFPARHAGTGWVALESLL